MVIIIINEKLEKAIDKKFKKESITIFELLYSLENNPHKGKIVGSVGGLLVKEIKYRSYRFYFIVDGHKLKVFSQEEFEELLIRFVRMSDKKDQQRIINEIKNILLKIGSRGFE